MQVPKPTKQDKSKIYEKNPDCQVVISSLITRFDKRDAAFSINRLSCLLVSALAITNDCSIERTTFEQAKLMVHWIQLFLKE